MLKLPLNEIVRGDVREVLPNLPAESVHCVISSPPYFGLRDYGVEGQLGLEDTLEEYIATMTSVFAEVRRILRPDGTCWLNIGDTYSGSWTGYAHGGTGQRAKNTECFSRPGSMMPNKRPPQSYMVGKNLLGVPWRLALALQEEGWIVRSDIIWSKPNAMPSSVVDRPSSSYEHIFMLAKSRFYYYDGFPLREPVTGGAHPGRNKENTPKALAAPTGSGPKTRSRAEFQATFRGEIADDRKARDVWEEDPENGRKGTGYTDPGAGYREDGRRGDGRLTGGRHGGFADWDKRSRHDQRIGHAGRDVWHVATKGFSGAHYATFPEHIVLKCLLAGTSEKGACIQCGTQHRRIVEPREEGHPDGPGYESKGWAKACDCAATAIQPAIVLDPFMGSGTVALVAMKALRDYVGVELNPKDVAMAKRRLIGELPLFAQADAYAARRARHIG